MPSGSSRRGTGGAAAAQTTRRSGCPACRACPEWPAKQTPQRIGGGAQGVALQQRADEHGTIQIPRAGEAAADMQLFDDEAVCAGTGTADVLAQRQAGDHGTGGQSRQLVGQCLGGCVIQRVIHGSTLQQELRLGVVGQDQIGSTAQCTDAVDQSRRYGGVSLAVVAHDRVNDLFGCGPEGKGFFG